MTDPGKAVFLSYASEDAEAAQRLCDALRASGVEVWFDRTELRGGDTWDQMIRRQIKGCYLFVPIISANTQAREEGYFRREWKLAVDRTSDMAGARAFLLPVVTDDTSDGQALVPEKFREVQWTRLRPGASPDAFVSHVCRLLSAEIVPATAERPRGALPPTVSAKAASSRAGRPVVRKYLSWIVAGFLIIAVGYLLTDKFRVAKPPETAATAITVAGAISDKSVAVLPFADMSEKHDQEYFTDGLAEELINRLAQTPELKVIARTSSFQFKGKSDDVRAIAAKLSVANLVEGSVRRSGARMRVTVQLVRAVDGTHIWSQSYDRDDRDALKVQDEIAGSVAKALSVSLHVDSSATPDMSEAYVLYLRGREISDHSTASVANLKAGIELLEQSVKLDPKLGIAWANLSRIRSGFYIDHPELVDRNASRAQSRLEAERALELAPQLAESHMALARIMMWFDWDWAGADREMQRALELEPGNAAVQRNAFYLSTFLGRWDSAVQQARKATEIDPLSAENYSRLASALVNLQKFPDAETAYRMVGKLDPNEAGVHAALANILWYQGKTQEALKEINSEPDASSKLWADAYIQFKLGHAREATAALNEVVAKFGRFHPFNVGNLLAVTGQLDEAFKYWDRAVSEREPVAAYLLSATRDPDLPNIGSDPRFKVLMKRLGLPE